MNFCKESDKYISLYIDELLDDKTRIEFLKHIKECSECARKLKEASYYAKLCREGQDITLPNGFSSSLHRRLLEVNAKESKSKLGFFVYNKKFIASLSTAAILVISLLAYNMIPQIGSKQETSSLADKTAQVETSDTADSYYGRDENENNIMAKRAADSASSASSQDESGTATEDVQTAVTLSGVAPETSRKTNDQSYLRSAQGAVEQSPSSEEPIKKNEINDETALFIMKSENKPDQSSQKYFMNYVELNLIVTPGSIEIEDLRKFMNDLGAIEAKPVTINSMVSNSVESTVDAAEKPPEFIDYDLPLSLYNTLMDQAAKHKLELSIKTDIVLNDSTDVYKELYTQIIEIDKKIEEAIKNGEDTTVFEAEKTRLNEEMNQIIAARQTVKVRIFFTP